MIAVREDGAATVHERVELARDANADALHAAPERAGVIRFDQQVNVVALDAVLNEPGAEPVAARLERRPDAEEGPLRAQVPDVSPDVQRDVNRCVPRDPAAWRVRNARAVLLRTPRAGSRAAVRTMPDIERELRHLESRGQFRSTRV